jgi:signal transduction histidine kinase
VGHELGAPLSVVGLRAGMIASGEATGDEACQNARIIVGQVDRMTRLVRQLLDYSRRQTAQASAVDVRQVVATTLDMLEPLAAKQAVRLDRSQPAEAVLVHADPIQLQQVLTNLAINGVQAMSAGGTLRVEVGRGGGRPAGRSAPATGTWVWIRVSDQGPGIEPEHLPHLFEPFYTTKAVGEGTGLGLAVAQAIVEEHGGWIDVTSEPGSGSRFTVWLAVAPAVEERLAS